MEIIFADDAVFVERLELSDIAHRQPMVARDALYPHIARGPFHEIAPVHPDRGHCPLDFVIVFVCLLELLAGVAIGKMMVPCRSALDLHVAHLIGAHEFEDAHYTCSLWIIKHKSIARGTHDVFSEAPEQGWFQHTSRRVLLCITRQGLGNESP